MSTIEKKEGYRPTVLIVLDGWGVAIPSQANGITQAKTPFFDSLITTYPTVTLQASGEATGLPWGEVGNSEVGHMSIGAGRIVYQELSRITQSISNRTFFSNEVLLEAMGRAAKKGKTLHLIGMASPGGVHSHIEHLYALLELASKQEVPNIAIHVILDGRDTPYSNGLHSIQSLQEKLGGTKAYIASMSGRFYAMDRDNHWDREEKAYRAIAEGTSDRTAENPIEALERSYEEKIYDEEFYPTVITKKGKPLALVHDGDSLIFFNIRADRARQLTRLFVDQSFDRVERTCIQDLFFVTMTEYEKSLPVHIAFPKQMIKNCLAEVISSAGFKQLHVAETEKYAHITYFLNDGREEPFPGEKRIMVPSPSVDSYDKKPEMSAHEITKEVLKTIDNGEFDFIAINFANADMVGHTGSLKATMKAIETLDYTMKQIVQVTLLKHGAVLITADHGNAEEILNLQTGSIDKEHSNNPVPCIIIAKELEGTSAAPVDIATYDLSVLEPSGLLSDVAPTILDLLGVPKPPDMTGNSILNI